MPQSNVRKSSRLSKRREYEFQLSSDDDEEISNTVIGIREMNLAKEFDVWQNEVGGSSSDEGVNIWF